MTSPNYEIGKGWLCLRGGTTNPNKIDGITGGHNMRSVSRLVAGTGMILAAIVTQLVLSTPAHAQRFGGFHGGGFHGGMGGFHGGFHGGMGFHGGFHHGGFHHHGFFPGIGFGLGALYGGYRWP